MDGKPESAEQTIAKYLPLIESFLRNVIQHGRFDLTFSIQKNTAPAEDLEAPDYVVALSGRDADLVLERHAELLNAIEYTALRAARVHDHELGKITFDCQNWRSMRNEELRMIAQVAAERVVESASPFTLSAMSPRERRIVHLALKDHPHVRTVSEGMGPERKVVVVPINPAPRGGRR
jgi:spoIIIJ-associated protein